jgi:hypothetical protein
MLLAFLLALCVVMGHAAPLSVFAEEAPPEQPGSVEDGTYEGEDPGPAGPETESESESETHTFMDWFEKPDSPDEIKTCGTYASNIAAAFRKTKYDTISKKELAAYNGTIEIQMMENAYPTNIELLSGITGLTLPRHEGIKSLAFVTSMPHLQSLKVQDNQIEDLSPLERCHELTELCLSSNKIQDLSPLAGLTNLQELQLRNNLITDISPLASLTGLDELILSDNSIEDLSPLAELKALTNLELARNEIADLRPLAGLTALEGLFLDENLIQDVSPLAGLTELTELELSYNEIEIIAPLNSLTKLEYVYLYYNRIADHLVFVRQIPDLVTADTEVGLREYPYGTEAGPRPENPYNPDGHTYGAWHVTKPATYTEEGAEECSCACGSFKTRSIPKLTASPGGGKDDDKSSGANSNAGSAATGSTDSAADNNTATGQKPAATAPKDSTVTVVYTNAPARYQTDTSTPEIDTLPVSGNSDPLLEKATRVSEKTDVTGMAPDSQIKPEVDSAAPAAKANFRPFLLAVVAAAGCLLFLLAWKRRKEKAGYQYS